MSDKMTTYITMLRGINVGGHRKILMADLRSLYESLGFLNVRTYIQSGNVLFESDKESSNFCAQIQQAILAKYGFEVPVILRSVAEVQNAVETNPYLKNGNVAIERLHLTFLEKIPSPEKTKLIEAMAFSPDALQIIGKDVFIYCADKYHTSKLTNNLFESKLKVAATTRNWKTVNKLLEMALST